MIPRSMMAVRVLVTVSLLAVAALARALPIQLTDTNSTRYNVNTQVSPLITASDASGALTNATYTKAETVTNTSSSLPCSGAPAPLPRSSRSTSRSPPPLSASTGFSSAA